MLDIDFVISILFQIQKKTRVYLANENKERANEVEVIVFVSYNNF